MELSKSDPFLQSLSPAQWQGLCSLPWQHHTTGQIPRGHVFLLEKGTCKIKETGGVLFPGGLQGMLPFLRQKMFHFEVNNGSAYSVSGVQFGNFLRTYPMLLRQYLAAAENRGRPRIEAEQLPDSQVYHLVNTGILSKDDLIQLFNKFDTGTLIVDVCRERQNLFETLDIETPPSALENKEADFAESARRVLERSLKEYEFGSILNLHYLSPYHCNALEYAILYHELRQKYKTIIIYNNEISHFWASESQYHILDQSSVDRLSEMTTTGVWGSFKNCKEAIELYEVYSQVQSIGIHSSIHNIPDAQLVNKELPVLMANAAANMHIQNSRSMFRLVQPVYPRKYLFIEKAKSVAAARLNFILAYFENGNLQLRFLLKNQLFPVTALFPSSFVKPKKQDRSGAFSEHLPYIIQRTMSLCLEAVYVYDNEKEESLPGIPAVSSFQNQTVNYGHLLQKK